MNKQKQQPNTSFSLVKRGIYMGISALSAIIPLLLLRTTGILPESLTGSLKWWMGRLQVEVESHWRPYN